jgi:hypothetical protein
VRRVDLEDASIGEVAKELRMTPNGVRVRLHRARADLKRRLFSIYCVCGRQRGLECDCQERSAPADRAMKAERLTLALVVSHHTQQRE